MPWSLTLSAKSIDQCNTFMPVNSSTKPPPPRPHKNKKNKNEKIVTNFTVIRSKFGITYGFIITIFVLDIHYIQ